MRQRPPPIVLHEEKRLRPWVRVTAARLGSDLLKMELAIGASVRGSYAILGSPSAPLQGLASGGLRSIKTPIRLIQETTTPSPLYELSPVSVLVRFFIHTKILKPD